MALTNLTPATAIDVVSMPYNLVISAADMNAVPNGSGYPEDCLGGGGLQHKSLWWTYTAQTGDTGMAFGTEYAGTSYAPGATAYSGTLPTLTSLYDGDGNILCGGVDDVSIHFPVTPGTTYYVQLFDGGYVDVADAPVTVQVRLITCAPVGVGEILITNDSDGLPASLVSPIDGTIDGWLALPAGEQGDVLPTGELCLQNGESNNGVALYTNHRVLIASVSFAPSNIVTIKSDRDETFYVFIRGFGIAGGATQIVQVSNVGVQGTTWTLPAASTDLTSAAVSRDGLTAYWMKQGDLGVLHAYDLGGSAPLPDLHGAVGVECANNNDGGVDAGGNILMAFINNTIIRYDSTGTILNTYPSPAASGLPSLHRFFVPDTGDASFWQWTSMTVVAGESVSYFQRVRLSDGVILTPGFPVYTSGDSGGNGHPFAIANSCPLIVLPTTFDCGETGDLALECQPDSIAFIGTAFSSSLVASGGTPPYTFAITVGVLPTGLSLNASTGEISGTPTIVGYYPFTAEVTDDVSDTIDVDCSISISDSTSYPMCRKCRFPLPFDMNRLSALFGIEFLIQSGVSPDAEITINLSKDGGYTWPITRTLTAGAMGAFDWRVYAVNFGQGRNWVCEFITSEPYFWALIQCYVDMEAGTS